MKKSVKFVAVLLSATILCSSCIGSFGLTCKLKNWNDSLGNKWVNELVFLGLNILPAYGLAAFADVLVLNSIEFWTGSNPIAASGESKIVKNNAGEDVQVTAMENGYNLSCGSEEMQLIYNEAEMTWNAVYNNQSTEIVKFVDGNNALLSLGK